MRTKRPGPQGIASIGGRARWKDGSALNRRPKKQGGASAEHATRSETDIETMAGGRKRLTALKSFATAPRPFSQEDETLRKSAAAVEAAEPRDDAKAAYEPLKEIDKRFRKAADPKTAPEPEDRDAKETSHLPFLNRDDVARAVNRPAYRFDEDERQAVAKKLERSTVFRREPLKPIETAKKNTAEPTPRLPRVAQDQVTAKPAAPSAAPAPAAVPQPPQSPDRLGRSESPQTPSNPPAPAPQPRTPPESDQQKTPSQNPPAADHADRSVPRRSPTAADGPRRRARSG